MKRMPAALLVFLVSGFGVSVLLALGERDWFLCFTDQTGTLNWTEARHIALEALTYGVSSTTLALQIFAPGLAFGLAWLASSTLASRLCVVIGYCVFWLVALWTLTPFDIQHACDQSGPFGIDRLLFLSVFGVSVSIISPVLPYRLELWKTRVSPPK